MPQIEIKELKNQLREVVQLQSETATKLQLVFDAVARVEITIQGLKQGFEETALMVYTLQDTSYNGTFIWKIPEVKRRRDDARLGKTMSLFSAPFYTSRYGYKMRLKLYMNGDGAGKGTHLSFFLQLMKGDYDALLTWPFKQIVTLTLLDQDKQRDIKEAFQSDPSSSSFKRPINEMNVASGFSKFVALSVLKNPSYVKDDTMIMKCQVDPTGINNVD